MKAMGSSRPGTDSVSVVDTAPPAGPGVRVRVVAAAVNPADIKVLERQLVGRLLHANTDPLVVGYDFSGVVLDAPASSGLRAGDEVFGHLPYASGNRQGSFAEEIVVDPLSVAQKPPGIEHGAAAAAATVGLTALQYLRDLALLQAGQRVLVLGAGGGVGLFAVAVAKRLGAQVTGVCSAYAIDAVKAAGADAVVDRARGDVLGGGPWDIVFDTTAQYGWGEVSRALGPRGVMLTTLPGPTLFAGKLASLFSGRRCGFAGVQSKRADLEQLAAWLTSGMNVAIAARFPARDLAAALARQKKGGGVGRIVVDVKDGF